MSDDSLLENDDVEAVGKMDNQLQYDKDCDHKRLKLQLGMQFKDVEECKSAVKLWAIMNGYNIRWVKSEFDRVKAICEKECPWKLYASTLTREPTCVIKTYVGEHDCVRPLHNRQATSGWIAEQMFEHIKSNPLMRAQEIQLLLRKKYNTRVELLQCYRAKDTALKKLRGTLEEHYAKLRSYISELQKRDTDGNFCVKTYLDNAEKPVFQRVYIGFSALRKGFFIGCRKFLSFDACFLKTTVGGALLAAVSKDCNQKMYPVAWAVVEKENEETWTWFMEKLFEDFRIGDGFGWTFMSDKQKGLINAVLMLAPNAEHRHCARHIYANWKKKYAGPKFQLLFWNVVKSTCQSEYNANLDQLRAESNDAAEDFLSQNPKTFCKSQINSYTKLDTVDNNICEAFNSYILKFRDNLLIDMLDGIRVQLMTRIYNLHQVAESSKHVLCLNIKKKLEDDLKRINECEVQPTVGAKYEVHMFDDTHIVDLVQRDCSCRYWHLTGLPCYHALASLVHCREDYVSYVDRFYYNSNWQACYRIGLQPIQGEKEWPSVNEPPVLPPVYQKQPGRPKKIRKRARDEPKKSGDAKLSKKGKVKMTCRKCGGIDHNKRTCKAETTLETNELKRPRGRPRKNTISSSNASTLGDQPTSSKTRGRPRGSTSNQNNLVINTEQRLASQGFGLLVADSGNVYMRNPGGRRVQVIHQVGSSQNSQITDGPTPP
ncbi:uncharacterized protein LOC130997145 [Salvia miltiorrhiza]|uniref:uncharacterized protein LOC130997145 n=1 Tax=Salvia miltiorrhiza TaxID=226208 RepID=UPI0025AD523D|nr:uncharacterized protein LOC130997145 [Salvia miltiorrhiza]